MEEEMEEEMEKKMEEKMEEYETRLKENLEKLEESDLADSEKITELIKILKSVKNYVEDFSENIEFKHDHYNRIYKDYFNNLKVSLDAIEDTTEEIPKEIYEDINPIKKYTDYHKKKRQHIYNIKEILDTSIKKFKQDIQNQDKIKQIIDGKPKYYPDGTFYTEPGLDLYLITTLKELDDIIESGDAYIERLQENTFKNKSLQAKTLIKIKKNRSLRDQYNTIRAENKYIFPPEKSIMPFPKKSIRRLPLGGRKHRNKTRRKYRNKTRTRR